MSQDGKCPRVANVPGRQMSQDGKCHSRQKSEGKYTIFWVLVESGICPKEGKCPERQMSQAANVPGWQMESGKCPKIEIKAIVL